MQIKAKIISNKALRASYWRCVISAAYISRRARPGQFINIKITDGLKPFLRRPFSVHNINGENLEIIYDVIGDGTRALSQRRVGEYLDIIGPLGNGFSLPASPKRLLIFAGGGIGVAPLLFLAREAKAKNKIVLVGSRSKGQVLCEKEFKNSGCDVKISTDDGSRGFKGRVTDLLKNFLQANRFTSQQAAIYACGPKPMLKAICSISQENNIPAQVSLEEHMSCGIGACLGCVVKTKNGLKRVCKEGPVFNAKELIW